MFWGASSNAKSGVGGTTNPGSGSPSPLVPGETFTRTGSNQLYILAGAGGAFLLSHVDGVGNGIVDWYDDGEGGSPGGNYEMRLVVVSGDSPESGPTPGAWGGSGEWIRNSAGAGVWEVQFRDVATQTDTSTWTWNWTKTS